MEDAKISWTENVTNEEVLVRAKKLESHRKRFGASSRKHRWLAYAVKRANLLHDIIEGRTLGKATRGRKRMKLLHDIMEVSDCGRLKDLISDRSRWR